MKDLSFEDIPSFMNSHIEINPNISRKVCTGFRENSEIIFTYNRKDEHEECILYIGNERATLYNPYNIKIEFRWIPKEYAGLFNVFLESNIKERSIPFQIDVLSKFDKNESNHKNFNYILNSLRDMHSEIYDFFSNSRMKHKGGSKPANILEQFNMIEKLIKNLEAITYQISLNPNKRLAEEIIRDKLYLCNIVDHDVIYDIVLQKGGMTIVPNDFAHFSKILDLVCDIGTGETLYLPDTSPIHRYIATYNVPENQLLKKFLKLIFARMKRLELKLENYKKNIRGDDNDKLKKIGEINKYTKRCKEIHTRINRIRRYDFLEDVEEIGYIIYDTSVLQRGGDYRRFYNIYKQIMNTPFFDSSVYLSLPITYLPKLYEYWILMKIICILKELKNESLNVDINIIEDEEFGYTFSDGCNDSIADLYNQKIRISLYYQKEYNTCTGRTLIPDITLEMMIEGKLFILVIDPKYRHYLGKNIYDDDPESAINKMHVYRDAIPNVEKAYAIYLGRDDPLNYQEIGVGGIRIYPNHKEDIMNKKKLKKVITDFIYSHIIN